MLASFTADGAPRWQRVIDTQPPFTPLVAVPTGLYMVESRWVDNPDGSGGGVYDVLTARDDGGN